MFEPLQNLLATCAPTDPEFAAKAHAAMPLLLEAVELLSAKCNPVRNNQQTHERTLDLFNRIEAFDKAATPASKGRVMGVPVGYLAKEFGGVRLELQVLKSAAGYYLGTLDEDGCPYSRESLEYWANSALAVAALNGVPGENWTQRATP